MSVVGAENPIKMQAVEVKRREWVNQSWSEWDVAQRNQSWSQLDVSLEKPENLIGVGRSPGETRDSVLHWKNC